MHASPDVVDPRKHVCKQICPNCGVNCFESKTSCFKCHTARPGYENQQKPRLVIPSGWLDCASVGDPIPTPGHGAGFLPMKVPLSDDFSDEKLCQTPVAAERLHTPKGFLKAQAEQHKRKAPSPNPKPETLNPKPETLNTSARHLCCSTSP
jgi:hypothetical protein